MLDIFVENFSIRPVVTEGGAGFAVDSFNIHPKEAAADLQILMYPGAILQSETCGVFVGRRSAGILAHAGFVIERDILPVPVTADYEHVLLGGEATEKLVGHNLKS